MIGPLKVKHRRKPKLPAGFNYYKPARDKPRPHKPGLLPRREAFTEPYKPRVPRAAVLLHHQ